LGGGPGNQSDTVDVAIELVSTATTHRGLYVGATRGRDDNRIHVITDSTDLAEARDVLEIVLAHDRADIPAVTQRRELARQAPSAQPAQRRPAQPASVVPDWLGPWRAQLEERREELLTYLAERADLRADAAAELADLQPALAAARAAWEPYASAIAGIEDDLRSELRPAMWKANHGAMRASFGHRHTAGRRSRAANERVDDADARVAAIYADGAGSKQRLDALQTEATNLADLAHPSPGGFGLEDLNREHVHQIDRLLNAVDVWTRWADGRSLSTTELAEASAILTAAARQAPLLALSPGEIDRTQWVELLGPVTGLLRRHGVALAVDRNLSPGQDGPDLSVDL